MLEGSSEHTILSCCILYYTYLELPVKLIAAKSGELVTILPNGSPSLGTKLITPSGIPASRRILKMIQLERMAASDGFHTVTFPIRAGVPPRLPPTHKSTYCLDIY